MNLISKLPETIIISFLALISGVLFSFGFPNVFGFLTPIIPISGLTLFLFIIIYKSKNLKIGILNYLFFSIGMYLMLLLWVPGVLKEFGNISAPLNHLLGSSYILIIAPQYLVFILALKFSKFLPFFKKNDSKNIFTKNLIIVVALTIFELHTPQLFPIIVGHSWIKFSPYINLSTIFGAYLFSFISFWLSVTILSYFKEKKIDWLAITCIFFVIVISILLPIKSINDYKDFKINNIRMVQANIGNLMKISSEDGKIESLKYVYETYLEMSLLPSKKTLDLIIWPETAYPSPQDTKFIMENPEHVPKVFTKLINKTKAELLVGGYDLPLDANDDMFQTEHNSIFFFKKKNKKAILSNVYNKIKLLPFGETLPFGRLNKYLSKIISNISYFKRGNRYTLFKTRNDTYFTTAICYEILFSDFIGDYLRNVKNHPHFIVNITNDSWFGNTLEPYQHLFASRWRAIEFQMPIVRMTNTGITSVLYPDGSESKRLPLFKKEILDIELKVANRKPTTYQQWGLLPLYSLLLILLILNYLISCFRKPAFKRS